MVEYKGYQIESDLSFGLKYIKYPGRGGQPPEMLKGAYTTYREAQKAIDYYLFVKEEEANKPAPIKKVKLTPREV